MKNIQFTFLLDDELAEKIKHRAKKKYMTLSSLLRQLIIEELERK